MNTRQASDSVLDRIVLEELLAPALLRVYCTLHHNGPMTAGETAALLAKMEKTKYQPILTPRLAELVQLKCVRTVGRRRCRETGQKATVWDVTACLPGESTADQAPIMAEQVTAELFRLRIENANLKLRLSRWGRPPGERRKTVEVEPTLKMDFL